MSAPRSPSIRSFVAGRYGSVGAAALLVAATGCSTFRSTERMDLTPFAEDMIAVAGEIQYSLTQSRAVRLRDYAYGPEIEQLAVDAARVRDLVRGTIAYSIRVVTLSEADMTGSERAAGLADYLDVVLRPVLQNPRPELHFTEAELDTVLDDIRAQNDMFGAIREAQPIVDEVAIASGELLDNLKASVDAVAAVTRERIEEAFAEVRTADRELRSEHIHTLTSLRYLRELRTGVPAARDSLVLGEPSLIAILGSGEPGEVEILKAEERIVRKLAALSDFRKQLQPDLEDYWQQLEEFNRVQGVWNAELRKARVAIIAWSRAHARLAAGVTDPAKIDVKGIARSAAGTVIP